ncbi:hypothetical protein H072_2929 [Dactylellina haptotyla CBS 200.50]|uniref:Presequence protease, mitochondrial n=1 Tax=Dactylellina haptotyla (strain CBS 200.50) TaxID=1284197 RepID=S8BUE3_DACHA|nr:hypothetical protein H072_2929 [Dactylellina haptotyla CBS 200.50]
MLRAARPLVRRLPLSRRSLATAGGPIDTANLASLPEPGLKLSGFTLQRAKHVPELELSALHFRHDKTGADYLHVAREDSNNVFAIGFKTNPPDATGLPHILEHTTLCGSKKFPVRDPFFKMLNRSLSNYMNAFTASDHTIYPFATTNNADYANLMDVYLDATLFPLLQETDFKQEGWRLGPENTADKESPIEFKGVVYNEMKGQMSDRGYLFYKRYLDHIVPALNNSGGDPAFIPDLTLEQLRTFHKEHYHPSNSKIFSYGNFPLTSTLERVDEKLSHFQQIPVDSELKMPITIDEPMSVTVEGPVDRLADSAEQAIMSFSWITCDVNKVVENFGLHVVSQLLMDGYGSPLYKALIEAGLGASYSPNTGYDTSHAKGIFSIGVQGMKEANAHEVSSTIMQTLKKARAEGFESQKVEGILHQLEISLKHKTANFGMNLMHRVQPNWFVGVDPFDTLKWNEIVSEFREKYDAGGYLEGLIEKYMLNGNSLKFKMTAAPDYEAKLEQAENDRLGESVEKLGGPEKAWEMLKVEEEELQDVQEKAKSQDPSCLPTLHVKDIPRQVEPIQLERNQIDGVDVQWRIAPTNGLSYFRLFVNFDEYSDELRQHLPLYAGSIFRLGTANKSEGMIEDEIKLKTGGISCTPYVTTDPNDLNKCSEGILFTGHCLDKNFPEMLDLLRSVIVETEFGRISKLHSLVKGMSSGAIDGIAERGHSYANGYASAFLTNAGRANESIGGLTQIKMINDLASSETYFHARKLIEEIGKIPQSRASSMRIAVTCGQEAVEDNVRHIQTYLNGLAPEQTSFVKQYFPNLDISQRRILCPLPFQVNYTGTALRTVPYTHPDSAALSVLGNLLTHKHLHHEIREKGGAYGGGAGQGGLSGIFRFYSYRDPNPLTTVDVVRKSGEFAANKQWSERDLEEAKLSIFQGVDAPKSVTQEGMLRFLDGVTEEMKQTRRERLLDVTNEDVQRVAQEYIAKQFEEKQETTVVIGDEKMLDGVEEHPEDEDAPWTIFGMNPEVAARKGPARVEL